MKILLGKIANFFSNKDIFFVLALTTLNFIIIKISFHKLFVDYYGYEISKNLERFIHGVLIILGSVWVIKKLHLVNLSGIRIFTLNNPLLLLIPFLYPMTLGLLNFSGFEPGKISLFPFVLTLLATLTKGLAEEYAFRGLLQSYLIVKLNKTFPLFAIICISSTVFALMHVINISRYGIVDIINQVIAAFFVGIFFGSLLLRTNNVFLLGIIHGLINFVFKLNSLSGKELPETYVSSLSEIINEIFRYTLFFFPLFVIGFILIRGRQIKRI